MEGDPVQDQRAERQRRDEPPDEPGDRARPRFPRGEDRRELRASDERAHRHRAGVAHPGDHERQHDEGDGAARMRVRVRAVADRHGEGEQGRRVEAAEQGDGDRGEGPPLRAPRGRHDQRHEEPHRPRVQDGLPIGVSLDPIGGERTGRGHDEADPLERLDPLLPREVVHLAGAQHPQDGEHPGEHPAADPHNGDRGRDGRDGDGDPHQQVARHQAVTRPNRRSRRW